MNKIIDSAPPTVLDRGHIIGKCSCWCGCRDTIRKGDKYDVHRLPPDDFEYICGDCDKRHWEEAPVTLDPLDDDPFAE